MRDMIICLANARLHQQEGLRRPVIDDFGVLPLGKRELVSLPFDNKERHSLTGTKTGAPQF